MGFMEDSHSFEILVNKISKDDIAASSKAHIHFLAEGLYNQEILRKSLSYDLGVFNMENNAGGLKIKALVKGQDKAYRWHKIVVLKGKEETFEEVISKELMKLLKNNTVYGFFVVFVPRHGNIYMNKKATTWLWNVVFSLG